MDHEVAATAPCDPSELRELLRLNLVSGIGPRLQHQLLEAFGTPARIFAAPRDELLTVRGVGAKLADSLLEAGRSQEAEYELDRCRELGVQLILRTQDGYPRLLRELPDAPTVLYCRGAMQARDHLAIAIVGSRRCTLYGRQQAQRLAGALARAGLTIVSGLARGIDAAAHRGALEAGGRTVAVAATGLASVYPPEHRELAGEIAGQGAVISESPLLQRPVAGLFPQRNRIISGISLGVLVVEATRNSGALHTCRHAMEQGREVLAVPGRIDSLASHGCHDLIRDGATLVRSADDVLEALGPLVEPVVSAGGDEVHSPRELTLNEREREVLGHVPADPAHLDEVLRSIELPSSIVLSTLTVLEIKRFVRRLPGSFYVRVSEG